MPLGARTTPSRRRVATCKPALPGGRFAPALAAASCRLVRDSNGSRRAALDSDSARAAGAPPAGAAAFAAARLLAFLRVALLAGLSAAGCAGVAAGAACAEVAAGFVEAAGLVWACKLLPVAASII